MRTILSSVISCQRFAVPALMAMTCWAMADEMNLNLSLGTKWLPRNQWDPVDRQGELGILFDFRPTNSHIAYAANLYVSGASETENGVEVKGSTTELQLGIKRAWNTRPHMHPFLGAGITLAHAQIESAGVKTSDGSIGGWVTCGIYWTIIKHLNIGPIANYSYAPVKFANDANTNAGGLHLGLLVGYHF